MHEPLEQAQTLAVTPELRTADWYRTTGSEIGRFARQEGSSLLAGPNSDCRFRIPSAGEFEQESFNFRAGEFELTLPIPPPLCMQLHVCAWLTAYFTVSPGG